MNSEEKGTDTYLKAAICIDLHHYDLYTGDMYFLKPGRHGSHYWVYKKPGYGFCGVYKTEWFDLENAVEVEVTNERISIPDLGQTSEIPEPVPEMEDCQQMSLFE